MGFAVESAAPIEQFRDHAAVDDGVHHYWSSELWWVAHDPDQGPRHVDFRWPMWAVFDRAAEGRGEWEPKLGYE